MMGYIDKEAYKEKYLCTGWFDEISEEEFDAFPDADVAPVVHSRWVQLNNTQKHYCFECGADFDLYAYCKRKFNYCPYCGAKMDLEDK